MNEQDLQKIRKIVREEVSFVLNTYLLRKNLLNSIDKFQDNMNNSFDKLEDSMDKRQEQMEEAFDKYETL